MATFDRRRFLQAGGATAASAAALSVFPGAIGKAMAMPALSRTRSIKDVDHVVILMQENRSFDHYFGGLRGVRGFGDPRPALLPNGRPVWNQPAAGTHTARYNARGLPDSATEVLPWYIDPRNTTEYQAGTDHGWSSGHLAWNEGRHDQWVNQKQDALTMGHLKRQDLLYHYALAEAFTICDSYFCSVHADTAPNRIYLWSGTCDPRNVYGRSANGPGLGERNNTNGYTWTTYPERLEAAKVSWKLYQGGTGEPGSPTDNYTDNSLMFFEQYQVAEGATGPLVEKGASDHTLKELRADVEHGTLPQVSWIVPPYKYSEHPSASPTDGATYINLVLEALTSNPEVWGRTVFIVNYDENDGLFDHVVPPMPPVGSAPGAQGLVSRDLVRSLGDEILDLGKYPGEMSPLVPGADPGASSRSVWVRGCRCWSSHPGRAAAGCVRRPSTTHRCCGSWRPGSGSTSRTSAPGAAPSAATSPRRSTSPVPTPRPSPSRSPLRSSRRASRTRCHRSSTCPNRNPESAAPARCRTTYRSMRARRTRGGSSWSSPTAGGPVRRSTSTTVSSRRRHRAGTPSPPGTP